MWRSNVFVVHINNNNNNNIADNVYGAVIMTESMREFTRFIWYWTLACSKLMYTTSHPDSFGSWPSYELPQLHQAQDSCTRQNPSQIHTHPHHISFISLMVKRTHTTFHFGI